MPNVGVGSSPFATYACVSTWLSDLGADLAKIDLSVLVGHGTDNRILPFAVFTTDAAKEDWREHRLIEKAAALGLRRSCIRVNSRR
jgi:hypothetical protein